MAKAKTEETPMMQQHRAIKQKYPDAVLLFRVGDFYETFGQDAIITSQVLGITLTKRNNGAASSSELAGFPHHSIDTYLHKLVKAGHRVAVCDQLEDPKQAKGVVKRGVTDMITPGTTVNDKLLEHKSNNFLAGIHFGSDDRFGLAFLDISTGEFLLAEGDREYADKLLQGFRPAEVIFQRQRQKSFKELFGSKSYTYWMDEWIFDEPYTLEVLLKHFQTHSLKGFGVEDLRLGLVAAGAIIHYLRDTEHPNLGHITALQRIDRDDFLWMDRFTIRNLELVYPTSEGNHTLLSVLDQTGSPMGARLLKRWLVFPLRDLDRIRERQDLVEYFLKEPELRTAIATAIHACGDVERLVSKIPLRKINPREVLQLARGLQQVEFIRKLILTGAVPGTGEVITNANPPDPYLHKLVDTLGPCNEMCAEIGRLIGENPPAVAGKGGLIREQVHPELDSLRNIAYSGKEYLAAMQQKEAEATGISSLKIGFNSVFGYYLEVTNSHKTKVPEGWIRKQTLTGAERYITEELKEYEEKITGAEEKILQLEIRLYEELVEKLAEYVRPIQINGQVLAILDCLCCFASNALQYKYQKPLVHEGFDWSVKDSRHPVIERFLNEGDQYVSNDLSFNKEDQQIIILTGPNMSVKSALLRQTALITLMAHTGSFVPATHARIPLTDKIFTRVGASDNLSGGESTFMVEMNETASIINGSTARSLILLDEIGRGTSTYDGISIAWSIVEHLHRSAQKPLTFFATHYHELNDLEERLPGVRNYHITNKESGNKIIFLRKLAAGGSVHSFGIHVARMAGMPPSLINRANEILEQLENKHADAGGLATETVPGPLRSVADLNSTREKLKIATAPKVQLSIFDAHTETFGQIRQRLEDLDIDRLTPVEALIKLQEIRQLLG